MFEKVSILLQKAPNLGRFKKDLEKKKIFMIIAEIPKANYCSFFCFLLTMDECIINVWGYTEILPNTVCPKTIKTLFQNYKFGLTTGIHACIGHVLCKY